MCDSVRGVCLVVGLLSVVAAAAEPAQPLTRIAFGSCARQDRPQPIWDAVVQQKPELFIFLGDNIYADTTDPQVMRRKYAQLAARRGFAKLRASCRILATWDDHDYGQNDAGAEYPMKELSRQIFLDFWKVPADSPRRKHDGVYGATVLGPPGRRVQVILLDTRWSRSPLKRGPREDPAEGHPGPYLPSDDPQATLLGDAQWQWLEAQLRKPAELRLICSSIQVIPDEHRYEKWGNLPRERERLFDLIRRTGAGGVLILSGDRHMAELSRLPARVVGYPLYELTSSALNQRTRWTNDINRYRIGCVYREPNFGLIRIDWEAGTVTLEIRGEDGTLRIRQRVRLDALRRGGSPQALGRRSSSGSRPKSDACA